MNELTREEKNRKNKLLAEWLGLKPEIKYWASRDGGESMAIAFEYPERCQGWCEDHPPYQVIEKQNYPDFYGDESASALALDKFIEDAPIGKLEGLFDWIVSRRLTDDKRRAAIADHCLKLIEASR